MFDSGSQPFAVFLLVGSGLLLAHRSLASFACDSSADCAEAFLPDSECVEGVCSNPFYSSGGCLKSMLPEGWHKIRACGSDDPPEAAELGYCRHSPFNHLEIRLPFENWDSAMISSWILQIIMAEMMDVPVSIEPFTDEINADFYKPVASHDYGPGGSAGFDGLRVAQEVGDCRLLEKRGGPDDIYQQCLHANPEVWATDNAAKAYGEGLIEYPMELGMAVAESWFVPKFTAKQYPFVTSYLGLAGEENREKLAEIFKRPTTWTEYCAEVSVDNCGADDGVAVRAPLDEEEGDHYFVPELYRGHFRATDENDCELNPKTCTGHIVDYPCLWKSFTMQQAYHNHIAFRSSGRDGAGAMAGYEFGHMVEIYRAANETRSHVAMMWWTPEPTYQEFVGTDAEMTPIVLPRPTQSCLDNRLSEAVQTCTDTNLTNLVGNSEGSCDYTPLFLKKIMISRLRELTEDPTLSEALWSPAADVLANYKLSALQVSEIYTSWYSLGVDTFGFDSRHAVCQWVVDNFELVQSFVPESYPRVIVERQSAWNSFIALPCVAMAMLLCLAGLIYHRRKKKLIYLAQTEFIYLVLVGLLFVSMGALLLVLTVTSAHCAAAQWLVNMGYAIVLPSIALKVDAINRLAGSGQRMQHLRLSRKAMYGSTGVVLFLVVIFLAVWSAVDSPYRDVTYSLTTDVDAHDETLVTAIYHCSSELPCWIFISYAWQAGLLFYSLILGLLASRLRDDVNDARNLTMVACWHSLVLAFRIALVATAASFGQQMIAQGMSSLLSVDCLIAPLVLLLPKICDEGQDQDEADAIMPDLFVNTTILIADVTNFTSWSSVRDPTQVFRFLDTLYQKIDLLAEKRQVFKVETMNSAYVAAVGLPKPQKNHAIIAAKFATDLVWTTRALIQELEIVYGPSSELSMRIGLHSGPVTGGFLQTKGARFQLFGDTMNLAMQIERSGESGRIQVSAQTAELLTGAGKGRWLVPRDPPVSTKGKGEVKTYWLNRFAGGFDRDETSVGRLRDDSVGNYWDDSVGNYSGRGALWQIANDIMPSESQRQQRLIDWNVSVLHNLLRQIVARRMASGVEKTDMHPTPRKLGVTYRGSGRSSLSSSDPFDELRDGTDEESNTSSLHVGPTHHMPLSEVEEIIWLPEFDRQVSRRLKDADSVTLSDEEQTQLKMLVTSIAALYNPDNSFHTFNHASHVVQAVLKMMNRIVAASDLDLGDDPEARKSKQAAAALHDHTYGITSDPLTQFACAFSALIHDIDHPGVPNAQLVKEDPILAATYKGRSVAEQNSFDLAWDLLMENRFDALRKVICGGRREELRRFRKLVINSVMATDLGDKELKALRNSRWDKAFKLNVEEPQVLAVNRKATIVIEHIIQAADVSHTMQHWNVYREWNENLFREMYSAYEAGRSEKNPADFWYEGEIGFFDFYIIPLSKKLAECGVFGSTSDENLNYATNNRAEWIAKGQSVVAEMLERIRREEEEKAGRQAEEAGPLQDGTATVVSV